MSSGTSDQPSRGGEVDPEHRLALEVHGVSKTFPGTRALEAIDLDIRVGEVHALVGQNGSGKSTLIKILAGFHQPEPGAEAHAGEEPFKLGDSGAAHQAGLRFVHQDLGLVASLDSVDNMALGLGYDTGPVFKIRWRAGRRAAREAIRSLGYEFDVSRPVRLLAPAERAALAIARSLQNIHGQPTVLVLDEPTAAMAQPEVLRILSLVKRVRSNGTAVLYVSHHLGEVLAVADRVSVFRDGRKVATQAVADLTEHDLVELMTGATPDVSSRAIGAGSGATALRASKVSGPLVQDVDLDVRDGEVVGLAGITGSGREVLCSMLFGGSMRTGTVTVGDAVLEPLRPDLSVANGVGFVPANRLAEALIPSMTVRENMTLPSLGEFFSRCLLRQGSERRDVLSWIGQLGIKTRSDDSFITELSGGNQQKVAVAKWLRQRPRVLIIDEPTQGVDVAGKAELHRLIDDAAAAGTAVLVSSSDEDELERLCDRVIVFRAGRVAAVLSGPEMAASSIARVSLMASEESYA